MVYKEAITMKGKISLKDFIHQVRDELVNAQDESKEPFYELEDVELEVAFALEAKGGAKGKLVVLELGGETKASQTHKVKLKLKPLKKDMNNNKSESSIKKTEQKTKQLPAGGGGGGELPSLRDKRGPVYDKDKDYF